MVCVKFNIFKVKRSIFAFLLFFFLKTEAQETITNYERKWELTENYQRGICKFSPYKTLYFLPFHYTNNANNQPITFNPYHRKAPKENYQNVEGKFQFSFKMKLLERLIHQKGAVWLAFSQQAFWQLYNYPLSTPFRDICYEPEVHFVYPLSFSVRKFQAKSLSLTFNHQSNGQGLALSRGWSRMVVTSAFAYENVLFIARFWQRFPRDRKEDDNPEIENYIGRADISLWYEKSRHRISWLLRNNLNFKENRAFSEFSYGYEFYENLEALCQFSYGYGASLLDYNHKQMTISVGIALKNLIEKKF